MKPNPKICAPISDALFSEALTQKLQTLIDGYEKRIADLTAEVHSLRDEVKALRKALDDRPRARP